MIKIILLPLPYLLLATALSMVMGKITFTPEDLFLWHISLEFWSWLKYWTHTTQRSGILDMAMTEYQTQKVYYSK